MSNSISHPCVTIDVLTNVWTGAVINIVVDALTIDMRVDVVIGAGVTVGIAIDMLTDVEINVVRPQLD